MKSSLFLAVVLTLQALGLGSQTLPPVEAAATAHLAASPRHGEWVTVKDKAGDAFDTWVVYPERKDAAPVVLVVHEIYGLTDWVRAVADSLAAEGFIAVAPDFLSGKAPDGKRSRDLTVEQARALNSSLNPDEVFRRLDAAARYATGLPAARSAYGVIGFCWGGAISFGYATHQPALKASVVYYGTVPARDTLPSVTAPVLGLYGSNDARVNAGIPGTEAEMKRLGKAYEPVIYDGAGHGFLRILDGQAGSNLKAAQAAWPRTISFLKRHLEEGKVSALKLPAGTVEPGGIAACGSDCLSIPPVSTTASNH